MKLVHNLCIKSVHNEQILNFVISRGCTPSKSIFDGGVPHSPSYGVYISRLIRFARECSDVDDFNNRNLFLERSEKILAGLNMFDGTNLIYQKHIYRTISMRRM